MHTKQINIKRKLITSPVESTFRQQLQGAMRGGWQVVSRYTTDGYHAAVVEMDLKTRTRKALMQEV